MANENGGRPSIYAVAALLIIAVLGLSGFFFFWLQENSNASNVATAAIVAGSDSAGGNEVSDFGGNAATGNVVLTEGRGIAAEEIDLNDLQNEGWNIVLISLDALRADRLGTYGYERNTSPNIDKFAENSIVFERAYSTTNWTLPSHFSVFSSEYPKEHGMLIPDSNYSGRAMLAEMLQQNGISNYAFVGSMFIDEKYGFARGYKEYENTHGLTAEDNFPKAMDWIDSRKKNEKFFLFIHAYQPHGPYFGQQKFFRSESSFAYDQSIVDNAMLKLVAAKDLNQDEMENLFVYMAGFDRDEQAGHVNRLLADAGYNETVDSLEDMASEWMRAFAIGEGFPSGAAMWPESKNFDKIRNYVGDSYDSTIYDADYWFGKFIGKMEKEGLLDDTIIILLSDHGDGFWEHNTFGHGKTLYAEETHVPLIVHFPTNKAMRIKEPVSLIDVAPTILDSLKMGAPESFHGRSLLGGIVGTEKIDRPVFMEFNSKVGVVLGKWKYVREGKNLDRLFDIFADMQDEKDLSAEFPEKKVEMSLIADAYLGYNMPLQRSDEDIEKLVALGYMNN